MLISELVMSQKGKQIIAIHMLPNISRSKDNQVIKFGQLVEYNMKNIFFLNHTQNVIGKLVPDSF